MIRHGFLKIMIERTWTFSKLADHLQEQYAPLVENQYCGFTNPQLKAQIPSLEYIQYSQILLRLPFAFGDILIFEMLLNTI